jgi:hypothetical protein
MVRIINTTFKTSLRLDHFLFSHGSESNRYIWWSTMSTIMRYQCKFWSFIGMKIYKIQRIFFILLVYLSSSKCIIYYTHKFHLAGAVNFPHKILLIKLHDLLMRIWLCQRVLLSREIKKIIIYVIKNTKFFN